MIWFCGLMIGVLLTTSALAQSKAARQLFDQRNLMAWCIVPFDSQNRTPEQRIEMLKELGLSQYAYDWRHQHLDTFASEIAIAQKNHVNMSAVWIWIDRDSDKPGHLSEDNERMLDILKNSGLKTQLWVGFNHNFFDGVDETGKINAGIEMVKYLRERTGTFTTKIGLYNHGDWFGNPMNQLKIVKSLNDPRVGIVYNFHHAHAQIDEFPALVLAMNAYLLAVNIDGMKREGPQILPVGSGDEEKGMLETLIKSGYNGPIGILCHIETEDAAVALKRNLDGLKSLAKAL
jgi:sugar phosphate isomerase/epimerase